jgi:hypothetical protein
MMCERTMACRTAVRGTACGMSRASGSVSRRCRKKDAERVMGMQRGVVSAPPGPVQPFYKLLQRARARACQIVANKMSPALLIITHDDTVSGPSGCASAHWTAKSTPQSTSVEER